jgi:hypothetical protein
MANTAFENQISISADAINFAIDGFLSEVDSIRKVTFAKIVVMELWTVRSLLNKLQKDKSSLDRRVPNLEVLRDAYAHIDERIGGYEKPRGKTKVQLQGTFRSLADGKLSTQNGIDWEFNGKILFNLQINGATGVTSVFGLIDDWLVCSASGDPIVFQIDATLRTDIANIVNSALK